MTDLHFLQCQVDISLLHDATGQTMDKSHLFNGGGTGLGVQVKMISLAGVVWSGCMAELQWARDGQSKEMKARPLSGH